MSNWFTRAFRDAGLMVHHIIKPMRSDKNRKEINRSTDERKLNENVTLRRTTIDEIEIKRDEHD